MTSSSFTSGPWENECGLIRANGAVIAVVKPEAETTGEDKANEALIASAPDMYEALSALYDSLEFCGHYAEAMLCKAVLRKARGEQ